MNERPVTIEPVAALALLLTHYGYGKQILFSLDYRHKPGELGVELDSHPFGLEALEPVLPFNKFVFLGKLGVTDSSVRIFLGHLSVRLGEMVTAENLRRLRIIQVPAPDVSEIARNLFFEADLGSHGTILCGGCNNYSGSGGDGGRRLRSVVDLISQISGVPVEEADVPQDIGASAVSLIQLASAAHYE